MSATVGYGVGFTLHRLTRRFFSELAISICASLAAMAILASGSPTWPSRSPAPPQAKLTARIDQEPQAAAFMESVALSHVGPGRTQARPVIEVDEPRTTRLPEKPRPRPSVHREAFHAVLPPTRPIELSAVTPLVVATNQRSSVFGLGSELLGSVAKALPSRTVLLAKVDSIGAKITGLVSEVR